MPFPFLTMLVNMIRMKKPMMRFRVRIKYDRGKEGNWTELTLAKTSGTVTRDREKIGQ